MELAIPLVVLGSMYLVSNGKPKREGMTAINGVVTKSEAKARASGLPNMNVPEQNYPTALDQAREDVRNSVNYYHNSAPISDKAYFRSADNELNKKDYTTYESLTGESVAKADFAHNNMVPFFGSSVKHNGADSTVNENILDILQGSNSINIKKTEIAPLFKPEEHLQYINGTPNMNDFMQSRYVPSMSMNNVKPFTEVRVAPAVGGGYGAMGDGGFNSGMANREMWTERNVDELRVATKPKNATGSQILSGKSVTQNRGIHGRVEKNHPDTFFINTPERYMTTTGSEKAQTARAVELLRDSKRADTALEYYGNMNNGGVQAPYVKGEYEDARREDVTPIDHMGAGHIKTGHGDYGVDAMHIEANNRSDTTVSNGYLGGAKGLVNAIVAPIMDALRPSRKENSIHNMRDFGNVIGSNYGYLNDESKPKTTLREMTPYSKNEFGYINAQSQFKSGADMNPQQLKPQYRETTNTSYMGIGGAGHMMKTEDMTMYKSVRQSVNKERLVSTGEYQTMGVAPRLNTNIGYNTLLRSDYDRVEKRGLAPQKMGVITSYAGRDNYEPTPTNRGVMQTDFFAPYTVSSLNTNPYNLSLR